jgi:outer membrane translocation and assembly module TamA
MRVPVWRDIGGAVFMDIGNVFSRVSEIELSHLRPTAGFGLRYKSPIGPIRVDLGFKLDRGRFDLGSDREPLWEFHISIGQAF